MKRIIYTSDFNDIALDFDSLFEDVNHLTDLEGDALHRILGPHKVKSVLDCACGTGIQSIGLARRGYKVAASDISTRMVKLVKEKAQAEALVIEVKRADFRNLKPWRGREFDAVISCGNSLTLLSSDMDINNTLLSMYSCLKKSGIVIIGIHNYKKVKLEGNNLLVRQMIAIEKCPSCIFDIRLFGKKRVQVSSFFLDQVGGRWRLKTYTKSYLLMTANSLKRHMRDAGFQKIRLLDISGQRTYNNDEWVLAVGSK